MPSCLKSILLLTIALLPLGAHAQNLIVNGSFENPGVSGGSFGLYSSIIGWTATGANIELGTGSTYGVTGQDGAQVCELDSTTNYTLSQTITGMTAGTYDISFLYARRKNVATDSATFDVLWNDVVVASYAPTVTTMSLASFNINATAGSNTLSFRGTGTADSLGGVIDRVAVVRTPEPNALLLLLGALPVAVRRRRPSA